MSQQTKEICQTVKRYIIKEELFSSGTRVLAAVSGGSDSFAMLKILADLQADLGFYLAAAHFDHQLRPESALEGQIVEDWCSRQGIDCLRGRAPVAELAKGENLEDTARKERYKFLFKVATMVGAEKIATAHHLEDQAETVLLHLLRGSGSEGLAAMYPKEGSIIRPLLQLTKKQLSVVCEENHLPYSFDESNLDIRFSRNRLRLQTIPFLAEYNPRLCERLSKTAEILRAENDLLHSAACGAYEECRLPEGGFDAAKLDSLPLALRRRIVRLAFEQYLMENNMRAQNLNFDLTERVICLKEGAVCSLPGRLLAYRQNGVLAFSDQRPQAVLHEEVIPVVLTDKWQPLADWGWEYRSAVINSLLPMAEDYYIALPAEYLPRLSFRTRRKGDSFAPAGMEGTKKLKALFIDKKISYQKRDSWPLLLLDEQIVWVANLRKGRFKAPQKSKLLLFCREIKKKI